MISIASTLIHPGRGSPASVSPLMSSMNSVRMTLTSISSSEENCSSRWKTTRVPRRASGKAGRSESISGAGGRGGAVIRVRARNAEELVEVSGYALDQVESKGLVKVLELVRIANALRHPTDRASSHAVRRVARCGTERLCRRVRKSGSSCGDSCSLKGRNVEGGPVHPSRKRKGSTERKHVRLRVVCCERWGS